MLQKFILGAIGLALTCTVARAESFAALHEAVVNAISDNDYVTAVSKSTEAATRGAVWAQRILGELYMNGQGVDRTTLGRGLNYAIARYWLSKAAQQGDVYAVADLGVLYYAGAGIKHNTSKAIELWTKAAKQGNVDAKTYLARVYAGCQDALKSCVATDVVATYPEYRTSVQTASSLHGANPPATRTTTSLVAAQRNLLADQKRKQYLDAMKSNYLGEFTKRAHKLFHEVYVEIVAEGVQMEDLRHAQTKAKEDFNLAGSTDAADAVSVEPFDKSWHYGSWFGPAIQGWPVFQPEGASYPLTIIAGLEQRDNLKSVYDVDFVTADGNLSDNCHVEVIVRNLQWQDQHVEEDLKHLSCMDYVHGNYDATIKAAIRRAVADSLKSN